MRELHARVCDCIGSTLSDSEAVAVAVAASAVRDFDEILEVLLNGVQAKRAVASAHNLAITDKEWEALFGKDCVVARDGGMSEIAASADFVQLSDSLASAMRCSLVEQQSRNAWARPVARLGCYVALHAEAAEERVASCLGGLVRADSRRLDDVRSEIEDGGTDHLLLCKVVIALGKAVC